MVCLLNTIVTATALCFIALHHECLNYEKLAYAAMCLTSKKVSMLVQLVTNSQIENIHDVL